MIFLTSGESHGKCLTGIISGFPCGVKIDPHIVDRDLARRQKGYGRGGRMKIENDRAEFMSGIRNGITTGSPISFLIQNKDWKNWRGIMDVFPDRENSNTPGGKILNPRPGHADLTGYLKYNSQDIRDVIERSSARETAARVCVGAVARTALIGIGVEIFSYVVQIGDISLRKPVEVNKDTIEIVEYSELRCPESGTEKKMRQKISDAARKGDTLGGRFSVIARGVPPGLGSYIQWDKRCDGILAKAFLSIPSVKEVEIGEGLAGAAMTGTGFHDEIYHDNKTGFYRKTNRAGGIEGGMTNGEDVVITASMKPIPTTSKGLTTASVLTGESAISLKERSDICAVPAASVVGESVMAIELLNLVQEKFGHDSMTEIKRNLRSYMDSIQGP